MSNSRYTVEKILDERRLGAKGIEYLIEWTGYPLQNDFTWEVEANIKHCKAELADFKASRAKAVNKAKVPTPKAKIALQSDNTTSPTKRHKSTRSDAGGPIIEKVVNKQKYTNVDEKKLKSGQWDSDVTVEFVDRMDGSLTVFILWKDGQRTFHSTELANQKLPLKMIKFYEDHLVFSSV